MQRRRQSPVSTVSTVFVVVVVFVVFVVVVSYRSIGCTGISCNGNGKHPLRFAISWPCALSWQLRDWWKHGKPPLAAGITAPTTDTAIAAAAHSRAFSPVSRRQH